MPTLKLYCFRHVSKRSMIIVEDYGDLVAATRKLSTLIQNTNEWTYDPGVRG